jgi:hypothetical protein
MVLSYTITFIHPQNHSWPYLGAGASLIGLRVWFRRLKPEQHLKFTSIAGIPVPFILGGFFVDYNICFENFHKVS